MDLNTSEVFNTQEKKKKVLSFKLTHLILAFFVGVIVTLGIMYMPKIGLQGYIAVDNEQLTDSQTNQAILVTPHTLTENLNSK